MRSIMRKVNYVFIYSLASMFLLSTGCQKSSGAVWEDTKTVGRYINRKGKLLWKKDIDSKLIESEEDFRGPSEEEFVALQDDDLKVQQAELIVAQPKETPGQAGSPIPSISQFQKPSKDLSSIFTALHFNTDQHIPKDQEDYAALDRVSTYLKSHPEVYIFVEGHCDARASEAYNLALGSRRANTIRNLLIKRGVNSNQVYTISFGKEMPKDPGHTKAAWATNRRAEFRIYHKNR